MPELPPVVIIAGPTASGKSTLALAAALQFNGEVINADSMQVYRELSVLTARPTAEDEAQVPHHLYGVLSGGEVCSAGRWLEMAVRTIYEIHGRGRIPILCGGTGLYLKVLREGIALVPDVSSTILEETKALYLKLGGIAFLEKLAELDQISADRLNPSDRQRLVRAYGVVTATGRTLPQWHKDQSHTPPLNAGFFTLHLLPDRAQLYAHIERRFDAMIEGGGFDEVKKLQKLNLSPSIPVMKALGVPEMLAYVSGAMDMDAAIVRSKQTTRNLAKRQMTWFRNQGKPDLVLTDFGPNTLNTSIPAISKFLSS